MTLASRLGTAFHMGYITADNDAVIGSNDVILSNSGVTQLQALVISVLSVLIVEGKHWLSLDFSIKRGLFLLATAVVTAGLTTMVLGFLTTAVLYYSTRYSIDPVSPAPETDFPFRIFIHGFHGFFIHGLTHQLLHLGLTGSPSPSPLVGPSLSSGLLWLSFCRIMCWGLLLPALGISSPFCFWCRSPRFSVSSRPVSC